MGLGEGFCEGVGRGVEGSGLALGAGAGVGRVVGDGDEVTVAVGVGTLPPSGEGGVAPGAGAPNPNEKPGGTATPGGRVNGTGGAWPSVITMQLTTRLNTSSPACLILGAPDPYSSSDAFPQSSVLCPLLVRVRHWPFETHWQVLRSGPWGCASR